MPFIFLFIIVPLLELLLLIRVGGAIGILNTVALVIATGILGSYLVRMQGIRTLALIQNDLSEGKMPTDRIFSGLLILIGGVLLITPGIMTDFAGLMLMIPGNRRALVNYLKEKFASRIESGQGGRMFFFNMPQVDPHDFNHHEQ